MEKIHSRARPHLIRLGSGDWWALSDEEKTAVAAYCVLTSMSYEYVDLTTLATTQEERFHLKETLTPPDNWRVHIGSYDFGEWTEQINHKGVYIGDKRPEIPKSTTEIVQPSANAQITVFTFLHLLVQTVSEHPPLSLGFRDTATGMFLQTIWPLGEGDIRKPWMPHSDSMVEEVAHGIEERLAPLFGNPAPFKGFDEDMRSQVRHRGGPRRPPFNF